MRVWVVFSLGDCVIKVARFWRFGLATFRFSITSFEKNNYKWSRGLKKMTFSCC